MFRNSVLFIWGFIIMGLFVTVFAVGMYEEKNKEALEVKRSLTTAAKTYLNYHKDKLPQNDEVKTVTYEELKEEQYIDELKYKEKDCNGSVIVKKYWIFYTYKPKVVCE